MAYRHPLRLLLLLLVLALPALSHAQARPPDTRPTTRPIQLVAQAITRISALVEPPPDAPQSTFTATMSITRAEGLPRALRNLSADLAYQAPDHLLVRVRSGSDSYSVARDGQTLWVYAPQKHFGLIGKSGLPRFSAEPDAKDSTILEPFRMPISADQLMLTLLLARMQFMPADMIGRDVCDVVLIEPRQALASIGIPPGKLELALRRADMLPLRIRFNDGAKVDVELTISDAKTGEPWPSDRWQFAAAQGDTIKTVALSHLTSFLRVARSLLTDRIPTLGPARGERQVLATAGAGRLELRDGTRVLFLRGTPQEMGRQQGTLLKKEIADVSARLLYGVGVASSFEKGSWFFGEIERAQQRLLPFTSPRYLAEADAMADAAGLSRQEIRLANFFPELFHCSGFALAGDATIGGRLYHGRILDYLRGIGLEQNAVVTVFRPDQGHAWVNISYAGFVGSVTAMNERRIAIGEMGGRGEGRWDGKPMAHLVREVMENASTLDQAVRIMRQGPRTCEYHYVISDGNTRRAIGIRGTPDEFETVEPGAPHPLLPRPVKDTVLLSAGSRYDALVDRVKAGYGRFDADSSRALMDPPVCMNSNIHSVLFAPETLEFWVANADSKNVASRTRYTHYNLGELLKDQPPAE